MNPLSTTQTDSDMPKHSMPRDGRVAIYRVTLAVLWTLLILILCWIPRTVMEVVEQDATWFMIPNVDKVVHWGMFVVFAIFWIRVGSSPRRYFWVILGGIALAVVSELGQELPMVGRDATLGDGVTDLIGILIGLTLAHVFSPLLLRIESRIFRKAYS